MDIDTFIIELYDYDENDQSFIIKLSPDRYLDIFNNLDHYPIRKRDINQNVINYIEDCSSDIPLSKNIKIEISIKREFRNEDIEVRTRKGIRNYFQYILAFYHKSSRELINHAILYIAIFLALSMFTFALEARNVSINKIFLKTILEGFSIGSWVFLWEAIASLTIKNSKNRFFIRTYQRLSKCQLVFKYEDG